MSKKYKKHDYASRKIYLLIHMTSMKFRVFVDKMLTFFRPLSVSSPTVDIFQVLLKVPFFLNLPVIHLKHLFWFTLLKYIFTPEFLRKADAFFAKSDELMPEFSAEV